MVTGAIVVASEEYFMEDVSRLVEESNSKGPIYARIERSKPWYSPVA